MARRAKNEHIIMYMYKRWGKSGFTVIHMEIKQLQNNNIRIYCILYVHSYKPTFFLPCIYTYVCVIYNIYIYIMVLKDTKLSSRERCKPVMNKQVTEK